MVPDGTAQAWIVDLPLSRGTEWNDWLAGEIQRRINRLDRAFLSSAFPHPHPGDFDIERFTRTKPFPLDEWEQRLEQPTVTFVWREDRLWRSHQRAKLGRGIGRFARRLRDESEALKDQSRLVSELAESLRRDWPSIDFAVVGVGQSEGFPKWIGDLRKTELDDVTEREWCSRYAASHLVIGTHGSNMLLPSAHAGGFIELLGQERWGNFLQDILIRQSDVRDTFFRNRFVPASTSATELAMLTTSILQKYPAFQDQMGIESCRHNASNELLLTGKRRTDRTEEGGDRQPAI
jgi:hypothetical protein